MVLRSWGATARLARPFSCGRIRGVPEGGGYRYFDLVEQALAKYQLAGLTLEPPWRIVCRLRPSRAGALKEGDPCARPL